MQKSNSSKLIEAILSDNTISNDEKSFLKSVMLLDWVSTILGSFLAGAVLVACYLVTINPNVSDTAKISFYVCVGSIGGFASAKIATYKPQSNHSDRENALLQKALSVHEQIVADLTNQD